MKKIAACMMMGLLGMMQSGEIALIRDGKPNDILAFMTQHPSIKVIAINGFGKYDDFGEQIRRNLAKNPALADIKVLRLPETSGSNKNYGWGDLNKLSAEWEQIFD